MTAPDNASAEAVLVTRPEGAAQALGQRLESAGYLPVYAPLLAIEPLPRLAPSQQAVLSSLENAQHIIFVSQNAIRCGLDWIDRALPQRPAAATWYTVGAASARALAERGIVARVPDADMTSEGLLALPELAAVHGDRAVIIKGEGGRRRLRESLEARGALVDELVVYRRTRPDYAPGELEARLFQRMPTRILISSGEGLDNMVSLLTPEGLARAQSLTLVVPGERVAEAARSAGFSHIVVADNATDDAMLAALDR